MQGKFKLAASNPHSQIRQIERRSVIKDERDRDREGCMPQRSHHAHQDGL